MESLSRWQRRGPIFTLILLAPIISEVLSGATRLSYLFALIPEILVWGLGALLIREAVQRLGLGARSMLLLGLALAAAEEFIIQQTSLAPIPWLSPSYTYGRVSGVNWVWLVTWLGFESVWVVLLPVQLTELLFRSRREEPWLRTGGLVASGALFPMGCFVAWYGWTQRARPMLFHAPKYQPPTAAILLGAAAILLLVIFALLVPVLRREGRSSAPWPLVASLAAFGLAEGWVVMIWIACGGYTSAPFVVPVLAGVAWAAVAFVVIEQWSRSSGWSDAHRLAVVAGAVVAILSNSWQGRWLPAAF